MERLPNIPPLRLSRGLLEITSTTIDQLAELHLTTCAKFAERNVDSVAGVFKAKSFADFVDLQRSQYQALWSDREDYMGSAAKIIRSAAEAANELWKNPPAPPAISEQSKGEQSLGEQSLRERCEGEQSLGEQSEGDQSVGAKSANGERPETQTPQAAAPGAHEADPLFELFEDQAGDHRFRLISADGSELLLSDSYKTAKGARNGIGAVRKNAGIDNRYQRIETDSGLPMFNLKAGNHQIIATSLPYQSASAMEDAVRTVRTVSASAPIADR